MSGSPAQRQLLGGPFERWFVRMIALFTILAGGFLPAIEAIADMEVWRSLAAERERLWLLLATTTSIAALAMALVLPAALMLAALLGRFEFPGRRWLIGLLIVGAFTPLVLYAAGWKACFGPYGFWPRPSFPGDWISVAMIHSLAALPWATGAIAAGLLRARPELEDQTRLDGGWTSVAVHVWLPAVRPNIALAALLVVVPILTDMTVSDLFVVRTFPEETYTDIEFGRDGRFATFVSLPICFAIALIVGSLLERLTLVEDQLPQSRPLIRPNGRLRLWLPFAFFLIVMTTLPMIGLVWQAGLEESPGEIGSPPIWSFRVLVGYLRQAVLDAGKSFAGSLLRAVAVAWIATSISLPLVWYWRWCNAWERKIGEWIVAWLLVVPGPVMALGWIEILSRPECPAWIYDSSAPMFVAQIIRALPYALIIMGGALQRLDRRMFESALIEGAGGWTMLFSIALPLLKPAFFISFLFTIAFSLTELPIAKPLAPPGSDPLSVRIFSLLHTGAANEESALCILLWSFLTLMGLCVFRWGWRSKPWVSIRNPSPP